jgi:predicted permease
VLTATVNPPPARYAKGPDVRVFTTLALDRVRSLPGVSAAGATSAIPFGNGFSSQVIMAEGYVPAPGESFVSPAHINVSDGYFEAMRVPLVRGRFFSRSDTEDSPAVAIVDERLAGRFWPNADPIGKRLFKPEDPKAALQPTAKTPFYTVVGVVKSVKLVGLTTSGEGDLVGAYYFPAMQAPFRNITLAIRSTTEPTSLVSAIRQELAGIDPEIPLFDVRTMTERMDASLTNRRTPMLLVLAFGVVALFLAAIGIYGVLAYQVTQRRREIGIRMAVGSGAASIFGLVIREGMGMVAVGFVLGLAGALAMGRLLESELYGVRPMDPGVVALVTLGLAVVALAACVVPARRAARVDPLVALSEP